MGYFYWAAMLGFAILFAITVEVVCNQDKE